MGITHIVQFRFKSDVSPEVVKTVCLRNQIPHRIYF